MTDTAVPLRTVFGERRWAITPDIVIEAMRQWTHTWADQVNAARAWQEALSEPARFVPESSFSRAWPTWRGIP